MSKGKDKRGNVLNVFTFTTYEKPWHIIYNIKSLIRNIKFAIERIKYGYCWYDLMDIDNWFSQIFPMMLENMIANSSGWHNLEGWENRTDEENKQEWHNLLRRMYRGFEAQLVQYSDVNNKYAKFLREKLSQDDLENMTKDEKIQYAIKKSNYNEAKRNFEKRKEEALHESMILFEKYYHCLWE